MRLLFLELLHRTSCLSCASASADPPRLQSKMTQCPDAHLFCVECVTNYAATLLGEHNPAIACMDQSGCKLLFAPAELRRILAPQLLGLYERVSQRRELEAAGLDGLEECPFCEYQVVIENEQEKLFRCEREECGAVSCRRCKKLVSAPRAEPVFACLTGFICRTISRRAVKVRSLIWGMKSRV